MAVRLQHARCATQESPFYVDNNITTASDADATKTLQTVELPAGWLRQLWNGWEGWTPRDWKPRLQGWKIHISTDLQNAAETLSRVSRICVSRSTAFKFLPNLAELTNSNSKQGDRGSSGKFITIYPDSDDQLAELLEALDESLQGQQGPYILSDLRFRDTPIFVRYGGIMPLAMPSDKDEPISSIVDPVTHHLIADKRQPKFQIPDGVELPTCLKDSYDRSRESSSSRLKEFTKITPLHFSNAGGVYKAELPDGSLRVLREARPHTGLDGRDRDAVERQVAEQQTLNELKGLTGVQTLISSFQAWEHRYLELEYIEGSTLTAWVVANSLNHDSAKREAYARKAATIGENLIQTVQEIHARGWCIGDLHPNNIIVGNNEEVTIIDFEDATRINTSREIGLRVFEYCAPKHFTAVEADWYAVTRSLMLMYVTDWEIEVIAPDFWEHALRQVAAEYGDRCYQQIRDLEKRFPRLDRHLLSPDITVARYAHRPTAEEAIQALDRGITWSQRFGRNGQSYPGDASEGDTDLSESFGNGRAGIVWARARIGLENPLSDLEALERTAAETKSDYAPGLYDGVAGIALALADAGRKGSAVAAARKALDGAAARRRLDLVRGQTGVILAAIEVARQAEDAALAEYALQHYERLHRTVIPDSLAWKSMTLRGGLYYGLTGLALLDLAAHITTEQAEPLDRAAERLRFELDACVVSPDGERMVHDTEFNRTLPYTEWGSAGIWAVASAFSRLSGYQITTAQEEEELANACRSSFYAYPCLDHGRAGTMASLVAAGPRYRDDARTQSELLLDSLLTRERMAFVPGDSFIRLSSDLSSGAAGVALALHAWSRKAPFDWLPLGRCTASKLNSAITMPNIETMTALTTKLPSKQIPTTSEKLRLHHVPVDTPAAVYHSANSINICLARSGFSIVCPTD